MGFYLTLPSNSSFKFFPDNTITCYTTKLTKCIELDGQWELALVELSFPYSFFNVVQGDNSIYYSNSTEKRVPPGHYFSPKHLIDTINNLTTGPGKIHFEYNDVNHCVSRTDKSDVQLVFSDSLARILGYRANHGARVTRDISNALVPLQYVFKAPPASPVALNTEIPRNFFIYCDLIEHQLVGDHSAQLLRIVDVGKAEFGTTVVKRFPDPHYVKLDKNVFDLILIDIRDGWGEKIPFEGGELTVKVHLRKCT